VNYNCRWLETKSLPPGENSPRIDGSNRASGAQTALLRCVHYFSGIRLETGGVARAVLDFCRVFAAAGNPTTLITGDATDVPAEWANSTSPDIPRLIEINPPRGRFALLNRSDKSRLRQALTDAQVLHLHTPWEPSNLQAAALARQANVPYVLSIHGMLDDWSMAQKRSKKRAFLKLAGNRLLRRAARVHFTAQAELEQAKKWLPIDNGVVLPLVMDLTPFENLPGPQLARQRFARLNQGGDKLLFLSRVHPKKGVDLLIKALADLHKRDRRALLFIAGPGEPDYLEQLRQLAAELGVGESVEFCGMVRGEEKVSLYQAADLFILPTSQENFGLVLIEALACRLPVITTRGVDIWKELSGAGASITDPDPLAIASAIEATLSDPTLNDRRERGRAWVCNELNPQKVVEDYESLYKQVSAEALK
jgi:glycosyltransferase involved in cell wall biosynthesis